MIIRNQGFIGPIGPSAPPKIGESHSGIHNGQGRDNLFENILKEKLGTNTDIKFSKHAQQRLETRKIRLSEQQNQRLGEGVKKAEEKGVKDSLILCDNLAFVVSIQNKTVVTALNGDELKNNVFTNIDGAVIV
jgi:flagellar operon protein